MLAHRGALAVQIVIAGTAASGSSKVPTRTKIKCGRASASLKSGVPQDGQNLRCIWFPLSATLGKSEVGPVTVKVFLRKQAFTVPLPAPRYWHSRHQHTRVTIGDSELRQRTDPQRHLPVTTMLCSNTGAGPRRLENATPAPHPTPLSPATPMLSPPIPGMWCEQCRLTLRCTQHAKAGFARFRERVNSNVRRRPPRETA